MSNPLKSKSKSAKAVDNSKTVAPKPATLNPKIAPFTYLVRSSHPLVWVETCEYDRFIHEATLNLNQYHHLRWNIVSGLVDTARPGPASSNTDPLRPIVVAMSSERTVIYLENYHRFLDNAEIVQSLLNAMNHLKANSVTLAVVAPVVNAPPELHHYFVNYTYPLPSEDEISQHLTDAFEDNLGGGKIPKEIAAGAVGLSIHEAENATALSLTEKEGRLDPQIIYRQKSNILKSSGSLHLLETTETLESLKGLENLKTWCRNHFSKHKSHPNLPFRGIMLLGVPGTGKSHFAKSLGKEVGLPTISMDMGAIYTGIVGGSETQVREALARVDAMSPCILFIDELEKGMSGMSSSDRSDAGTAARVGSKFLTWLQDHTTEVFTIATCNDISKLPLEMTRAGRWDAIFFVGVPNDEEREAILQHYCKTYKIPREQDIPALEGWTGAEIRQLVIEAAYTGSLMEASSYVVPLIRSQSEQIIGLTEWAKDRCVPASNPPKPESMVKRRLDAVMDLGAKRL